MHVVTANGATIPALGFGVLKVPNEETPKLVSQALNAGFRHIDAAQIYGNEAGVGEALAASGVRRHELFLTTKVWVQNYRHADFLASVDESLAKLQTSYVDLLLLHWPKSEVPLAEQVASLNAVAKAGKARHIGVSNFTVALMDEAVRLSEIPLVVNQVEYHPYLDQKRIIAAAGKHGMAVAAYYAMANGNVFKDETLQDIASKNGKSVAQIVLRWLVQQPGIIALSKTASPERAFQNLQVFDFELNNQDMATIHSLAQADGRLVSPAHLAPEWDPT